MSNEDITFGWVIQPTPKKAPEGVTISPTEAAQSLIEANERYIEAMRPQFDAVWVEDHFQWDDRPTLEAMTTLTYLAARHEGLRFGHIVLGQSYRNAAYTAKMAANLQMLTRGKFILGIGAGWKEDEYRAYGYPYPPAGQRIDELEDAVQIIRAMWTQSPATFEGKYYRIEGAECQPQPDPPVPLLIAGGGEKRTLRVVAKYADWWNTNLCDVAQFAHKKEVLYNHCREIGRDPVEIVLTYNGWVSIAEDPAKLETRDAPYIVRGNADAVTKELEEFVKLGVKHFQLKILDFPETDGLELFKEKVVTRLRG